jgi:hypothetical protein
MIGLSAASRQSTANSKQRYTILVAGDQNSAGALTSISTTNQVIIAKIQTALKLTLIMSTLPCDVNVKIKLCRLNTGIIFSNANIETVNTNRML